MSRIAEVLSVDEPMRGFREQRKALVREALHSLRCEHPMTRGERLSDFAVANEVAVSARARVTEGEGAASLDEVTAQCEAHLASIESCASTIGPALVVRCIGLEENQSIFSPGITIEQVTPEEADLVVAGLDVLAATGNLDCFADNAGLIVVLGLATPEAPVATWATGVLASVVHLHLMPRPELVARDLIHEGAHTYLNDWLAARDVRLDARTPQFWSPWKDTRRPLFGFVHSILAFSVVAAFLRQVTTMPGRDWRWIDPFLEHELVRLRECAASVAEAVTMLPGELGQKIETVYELATR